MATLTRSRVIQDDVSNAVCDLRLGVPTPFPSNELARDRDELLTTDRQLLHAGTIPQPPSVQDAVKSTGQDARTELSGIQQAVSAVSSL